MTKNFCPHIEKAKEAFLKKSVAPTKTIKIAEVLKKVTEENLEQSLLNESSDGEVAVHLLPGGNIVVPILDTFSSYSESSFVHVRDFKCSLAVCSKQGKTRKHTLVEKGTPHCPHSILGNYF